MIDIIQANHYSTQWIALAADRAKIAITNPASTKSKSDIRKILRTGN